MKRLLITLTILGLTVGSVATADAKRKPTRVERTVEGSYDTQFVPFGGMVTHECRPTGAVGCVTIATRAKEGFLTARLTDAHGQPVLVEVSGRDPSSGSDYWSVYGSFCGETDEPIAFTAGVELRFSIGYFWIPELPSKLAKCPPMFGTTGTISVTLSNLP